MKNNPEWKPFIEAVRNCDETPLTIFLGSYPARLRMAAALGLSLVKWYLNSTTSVSVTDGRPSCGCCVLHGDDCKGCPLDGRGNGGYCVYGDLCADTYNNILAVYTEHFNALPARDRQAKP